MIDASDILRSYRTQLVDLIAGSVPIPRPAALPVSIWLASSLLQKAIRRGRKDFALAAASTLLASDPARLWRRLGVTAWEDVGTGDLEAVGLVTSVLSGVRVRNAISSDWAIASNLISLLCEAAKSRSADDLLMISDFNPGLHDHRLELAIWHRDQLRRLVLSDEPLPIKAIALRYLWGIRQNAFWDKLQPRKGEPWLTYDVLDEYGVPPTLITLIREAQRTIGTGLPLLAGLLFVDGERSSPSLKADLLPSETKIGPVPGWALDMFTREGKEALRRLMKGQSPIARFARGLDNPPALPLMFGHLLFFAEGGLLVPRACEPLGYSLRHQAETECLGLAPSLALEALDLMRQSLPELNAHRVAIVGGQIDGR